MGWPTLKAPANRQIIWVEMGEIGESFADFPLLELYRRTPIGPSGRVTLIIRIRPLVRGDAYS